MSCTKHTKRELELGFQLERQKNFKKLPIKITYLNFANNLLTLLALLTQEIEQAQEVLRCLENAERTKTEKNKRNQRKKGKRKCCCEQYLWKIQQYGDTVCKFAMCTLIKSQISPTCSYELFMCNKTNHNICYNIISYEVHTFKNGNKI